MDGSETAPAMRLFLYSAENDSQPPAGFARPGADYSLSIVIDCNFPADPGKLQFSCRSR